jgi:hypothetical protein
VSVSSWVTVTKPPKRSSGICCKLKGAKLKRSGAPAKGRKSAGVGVRPITGAIRVKSCPSRMKRPFGVPELQVLSQAVAPGLGKSDSSRRPALTASCLTKLPPTTIRVRSSAVPMP